MNKTFREILAEKDDEFIYHVRSTANIHNPEIFERIRLSFMPYDVKSFDCDTYRPLGKRNKEFPDEPNSPTYSVRVVTGLPLTPKFIETLALDARINVAHLRIDGKKDEQELVNEPGEVKSGDAQSLVGTKRLGEFIRELQADRKARMGMTIEREVYESVCTTHRGLGDVLKKPLRKGYYVVEAYRENGKNYLRAEGPFPDRPEHTYHDRIRINNAKIVAEQTTGDTYGVQLLIEDIK